MATDPIKTTKVVSNRAFKDDADRARQEKADREGSAHPFQKALKHYESKGVKVFHYNDKTYQHSDKPFKNSRPIAARTTKTEETTPKETKPISQTSLGETKVKPMDPKTKVPMVKAKTEGKIKPIYEQNHKGKRSHSVVKNNIVRKIEAKINPGKYGAESSGGKMVNINRANTHNSGKVKIAGYEYPMGNGKSVKTKSLKAKDVIKAAKKAGYTK